MTESIDNNITLRRGDVAIAILNMYNNLKSKEDIKISEDTIIGIVCSRQFDVIYEGIFSDIIKEAKKRELRKQ